MFDTSMERFNNALDKSIKPLDGNFLTINACTEDSYDINLIEEYLIRKILF